MDTEEAIALCKRLKRGEKIELGEALSLVGFIPEMLGKLERAESRLREIKRITEETI